MKNLFTQFSKEVYAEVTKGRIDALSYFTYYSRWKSSLEPGRTAIADEQPWITYPVIDFLAHRLGENTSVFEYGCGGSTLYFVNRVKKVITVEHDPYWYALLAEKVTDKGKSNWTGHLVLPEAHDAIPDLDPAEYGDYYTTEDIYASNTFRSYASSIDTYPDGHFDMVLVDGRSRPSCVSHSIPKIKTGGLLIVDNSNRNHYVNVIDHLVTPAFSLVSNRKAPSPYASFFTQTGLWKKR